MPVLPASREQHVALFYPSAETLQFWNRLLKGEEEHFAAAEAEKLFLAFLSRLDIFCQQICYSLPANSPLEPLIRQKLPQAQAKPWQPLPRLLEQLLAPGDQPLSLFEFVAPLFDLSASARLFDIHSQYGADYSFCENLPAGLSPVFFSSSLLPALPTFSAEESRQNLCRHIEKNINKYHVEIHYEEPDLRLYRLDFSCNDLRSLGKTSRFLARLGHNDSPFAAIAGLIEQEPDLLFSQPSWLELEIFSGCDYTCTFCPRSFSRQTEHSLSGQNFQKIVQFIDQAPGPLSVCLGGMGEPLQHPEILSMARQLLAHRQISSLVIETNGYYLPRLESLLESEQADKLYVVTNLNSLKNYASLHGVPAGHLAVVKENLASWAQKARARDQALPARVYIQTLKIEENEPEIDEIYELSQSLGISFLLQKYNDYAGLMPQKRVSDMTPLERSFCWHLRRDLYVRADGQVSFCKQDIQNQAARGHLANSSLAEIWAGQQPDWVANHRQQYPQQPDCRRCDEYFTFNF